MLAGRNAEKVAEAEEAVLEEVPTASLDRMVVDLASQESVREAATSYAESERPLDLLVNNAGIMAPPYAASVDGFESQMATNHFGPFLLTGLLLPRLRDGGRVVTVASQMHRVATKAPLGDPTAKPHPYLRWVAYGQTKLANLLFTFELDRRLRTASRQVSALAAHPGYAGTHLVVNGRFGRSSGGVASILDSVEPALLPVPGGGCGADPDGGHRRSARLDVLRALRPPARRTARRRSWAAPGSRPRPPAPASRLWDIQRAGHRDPGTPERSGDGGGRDDRRGAGPAHALAPRLRHAGPGLPPDRVGQRRHPGRRHRRRPGLGQPR